MQNGHLDERIWHDDHPNGSNVTDLFFTVHEIPWRLSWLITIPDLVIVPVKERIDEILLRHITRRSFFTRFGLN